MCKIANFSQKGHIFLEDMWPTWYEGVEILHFRPMHVFVAKVGIAVIVASIALSPGAVFAHGKQGHVRAATHDHPVANLLNKVNNWKTSGGVHIASDGTITLTENGNESERAYKDVDVTGRGGDTAVLVAYTKAESVRSNDITGLPYIHAYAMNKDGKILEYFKGKQMRHDGKRGEWQVSHGTFHIPAGTTTIRYFVEQAEKQGSSKNGDDAMFKETALYVVEHAERAKDLVQNYRFGLSLLQ